MKLTEEEINEADESHMEGKAIVGGICFVLMIIGIIIWTAGHKSNVIESDFRQLWLDDPINKEVENIA